MTRVFDIASKCAAIGFGVTALATLWFCLIDGGSETAFWVGHVSAAVTIICTILVYVAGRSINRACGCEPDYEDHVHKNDKED